MEQPVASTCPQAWWNDSAYRHRVKVLQREETEETKLCTGCFTIKPLVDFTKMPKGRKGVHPHCQICTTTSQKRQYAQGKTRNSRLQRLFGVGLVWYEEMLRQQAGTCAICGRTDAGRRNDRLLVDHDHVTGSVRALLCHKCNAVLGMVDDDPERLEAAAHYLRAFKGT